jgi:hypothetical protein
MSDKCKECKKSISVKKPKIQCSDCVNVYHGVCVNLSTDDITYLSEEQGSCWRCPQCNELRRKSLRVESALFEDKTNNTEVILDFLKEMREESRKQIGSLETELGKSVEACHQRIEDLVKIVEDQSNQIKEYKVNFEQLAQENSMLRKKVSALECQLDDAEQYSRVNCLEINGIPETPNENVTNIIKSIAKSLEVDLSDESIDACHRLGNKQDGRRRGIIVKFTRRIVKEDLLQRRKVKRNFNTSDIGITSGPANTIYINESLTQNRRKVLNAARAIQKEKNFAFVWVKNGKIFLRKREGERVIVLTSLDQVNALKE